MYPALGIKRGGPVTPIETYAIFPEYHNIHDRQLACLFHLRTDIEFRNFERQKLFGNPMFRDFKQTEDDKGVYIFGFEDQAEDWDTFVKGKYSRLSTEQKKKIKAFYGTNSPNYPYIESFLHPEKYFRMYADMLHMKESVLKEVGELCSLPDLEKETLNTTLKNLEIIPQSR